MKVLGFIMLHYGKEYLEYALKPLCEVCDKVVILYSKKPTHNQKYGIQYRETRGELRDIALPFGVHWVDVFDKKNEGDHMNEIWNHTNGYDVLVRADYDEVWDVDDLRNAVKEVYNTPFRNFGINGFIHFWRSFGYIVSNNIHGEECDYFRPLRLWHLREKNISNQPDIQAKIYHFGYAIKRRDMEYKMQIHGHRPEIREEWLSIWNNWQAENTEGNFHPTSFDIWLKIKQFDRNQLPEIMKKHPYFTREII